MEAMTFPAPGAVTLEISIGAGDVRVREQAGAVSLHVTGEQDPDQVTIESSEEPDGSLRITVTERRRGISGWKRRKGLDITVDTPAQTTLDIDGGAVDLRSKGQVAGLRFASGSGDARLDDVADDVVVKGASGDVRVRHVGGQLRVHLASGDVFADSVVGGATVRTASGDIALGTLAGESSITSLSGDVVIHRAEPALTGGAGGVGRRRGGHRSRCPRRPRCLLAVRRHALRARHLADAEHGRCASARPQGQYGEWRRPHPTRHRGFTCMTSFRIRPSRPRRRARDLRHGVRARRVREGSARGAVD